MTHDEMTTLQDRLRQDHSDAGAYLNMHEAADLLDAYEAALREALDALAPYMGFVGTTKLKNHAALTYDKINELLEVK